ncbi:MAG: aminomethyl-transferring glycine dehydrogenase subunit GcvPB, partial [Myxococcota bacterium]|nr:aminomethyl-transferring glycine dehydrogenase subunit GcvPB [Myxococcota bacterium]
MSALETEAQSGHPRVPRPVQGLQFREPLLFERSSAGRRGHSLPVSADVSGEVQLPASLLRHQAPEWPELSEPEVVRHFVRLSHQNYAIDVGFFPLGSCTMKYNPKINETVARMPGFAELHPYAHVGWMQGALRLMKELEGYLAEIAGFDALTLQPAAGAQGEFTALKIFRSRLIARDGRPRTKVLVPDTAHGTNPASCTLNGYTAVPIASSADGILDPVTVAEAMDDDVAAIMVTNPNTLGLFETHIAEVADIVHRHGGFVYCDGANLNALMGRARPGDMGVDAMHINLHKTFSTPHGGGGPGSGPVGVTAELAPYLPTPRIVQDGDTYDLDWDRPASVGRVKAFFGNFGMHVRAYTYIRELGRDGLLQASEMAVLNANYLRVKLSKTFHMPYDRTCMHEVVVTDRLQRKATGIETKD